MDVFQAIENGSLLDVREIVERDRTTLSATNRIGFSPLMTAIGNMERKFEIIEYLVKAGADVNFKTKEGYTPLHANVDLNGPTCYGELPYKVACLLKDNGADTEACNHYGWTPLMRAALEGTPAEFEALLRIGARFDLTFPPHSMPEFSRGQSLVSIVLDDLEKLCLLLGFGLVPDSSLLDAARNKFAQVRDSNSAYAQGLKKSLELLKKKSTPSS